MREKVGIIILGCSLFVGLAVLAVLQKPTDCFHSMVVQRIHMKVLQTELRYFECSTVDPIRKKSRFSRSLPAAKTEFVTSRMTAHQALQVQKQAGEINKNLQERFSKLDHILQTFKTFPRGIELSILDSSEKNRLHGMIEGLSSDGLVRVAIGADEILFSTNKLEKEVLKIAMRSQFPGFSEATHTALAYLFLDSNRSDGMKYRSWISLVQKKEILSLSEVGDFVGGFISPATKQLSIQQRYQLLKNWRVLDHRDIDGTLIQSQVTPEELGDVVDRVLLELESVALVNPYLKIILGSLENANSLGFYSARR